MDGIEPEVMRTDARAQERRDDIVAALEPILAEVLELSEADRLQFRDLMLRKYGPEHYEFNFTIRATKGAKNTP